MTPPDSDERCAATRTDRCERKSGHDGPHWPKPTEHATWKDEVLLSPDLAQRILAALERLGASDEDLALAAELRDRVPR